MSMALLLLLTLSLTILCHITTAVIVTSPLHFNNIHVDELVAENKQLLGRSYEDVEAHRRLKRSSQMSLKADSPHRVEIWDAPFPIQMLVPAALGNPPQPFRLHIDLAFDTLFVPDADIKVPGYQDPELLRYHGNRSETFVPSQEEVWSAYAGVRFEGYQAFDTFRIAGLEIPHQPFLKADQASPIGYVYFWFGYEGVLGLAPRWGTSIDATLTPSPWSLMVNQSVLDHNIFAIDVPRGPRDMYEIGRTGEISFGGISPKYQSSTFSSLPLSDYDDQVWAVEAQSVTFENETHPIHQDFVNKTLAGFDTTAWFIGLPGKLTSMIYASVEHECGFLWCEIDCLQRKHMPDLTLKLAGQNFTLTPYDYAPELVADGFTFCTFTFLNTDDMYPVDAIVLGPQFMNAFYSVFDLDNREIRLTKGIE